MCQKPPWWAWTIDYIPQYLWGVITCPCHWYLLLEHKSSILATDAQWLRLSCRDEIVNGDKCESYTYFGMQIQTGVSFLWNCRHWPEVNVANEISFSLIAPVVTLCWTIKTLLSEEWNVFFRVSLGNNYLEWRFVDPMISWQMASEIWQSPMVLP